MRLLFFFFPVFLALPLLAQTETYQERKAKQLAGPSPFQKEIDGEFPERIAYRDDLVVALNSFAPQAPVHVLIVPRKRIPTINDLSNADSTVIARMFLVAQKIALERGVAESGYRLVFNTNEDAGQSAFHIHLHLLGGMKTGPMVDQRWRTRKGVLSRSYQQGLEKVRTAYETYFTAWLQADSATLFRQMTPDAVLMPPGLAPLQGQAAIRAHWFPQDGSRTTVTAFTHDLDEIQLDGNLAYVRGRSVLSFTYEKDGQTINQSDLHHNRLMVLERQDNDEWLIRCHMWNPGAPE